MDQSQANQSVQRLVREIFEERIPFNRMLGLELEFIDRERASMRFAMSEELLGNYARRMLHGGVIAAVLDATAGLVAFLGVMNRMQPDVSIEERKARFSRIGTIDMRVDYLRPAMGAVFVATAHPLRNGNRVTVIRTELHNDDGELVASGTCTYMVG